MTVGAVRHDESAARHADMQRSCLFGVGSAGKSTIGGTILVVSFAEGKETGKILECFVPVILFGGRLALSFHYMLLREVPNYMHLDSGLGDFCLCC